MTEKEYMGPPAEKIGAVANDRSGDCFLGASCYASIYREGWRRRKRGIRQMPPPATQMPAGGARSRADVASTAVEVKDPGKQYSLTISLLNNMAEEETDQ